VFRETGTRCYGDIEHSVPLMEGMLIACIAQQLPGRRLEWDARRRTFGTPEADALIRPFMRSGW
jgi:hypothetical protein